MACISLNCLEDTEKLARWLAAQWPQSKVKALLLHGQLGSGKTTLSRALVQALPHGEEAEVSSPSFTVCNHYPTEPPVLHCDLYRCAGSTPDELLDALDDGNELVIVEWAEYLAQADRPQESLDFFLYACEDKRRLTIEAHGRHATQLMQELCAAWAQGLGDCLLCAAQRTQTR